MLHPNNPQRGQNQGNQQIQKLVSLLSVLQMIISHQLRNFAVFVVVSVLTLHNHCTFLVFLSVQYHLLRLYFYSFRIATKDVIRRAHCKILFYHCPLPQIVHQFVSHDVLGIFQLFIFNTCIIVQNCYKGQIFIFLYFRDSIFRYL